MDWEHLQGLGCTAWLMGRASGRAQRAVEKKVIVQGSGVQFTRCHHRGLLHGLTCQGCLRACSRSVLLCQPPAPGLRVGMRWLASPCTAQARAQAVLPLWLRCHLLSPLLLLQLLQHCDRSQYSPQEVSPAQTLDVPGCTNSIHGSQACVMPGAGPQAPWPSPALRPDTKAWLPCVEPRTPPCC